MVKIQFALLCDSLSKGMSQGVCTLRCVVMKTRGCLLPDSAISLFRGAAFMVTLWIGINLTSREFLEVLNDAIQHVK